MNIYIKSRIGGNTSLVAAAITMAITAGANVVMLEPEKEPKRIKTEKPMNISMLGLSAMLGSASSMGSWYQPTSCPSSIRWKWRNQAQLRRRRKLNAAGFKKVHANKLRGRNR